MGVVGLIHGFHLICSRTVALVAFAADGSTVFTQLGGGGPPYSSVSSPRLWPSSWRTISTEAVFVDATATEPPEPPYWVSLTITMITSRAFALAIELVRMAFTFETLTQIRRVIPEQSYVL